MHPVWSILVSVVWGALSAHLLLQTLLFAVGIVFGLRGLVAGRVAKSVSYTAIGVSLLSILLFGGLLYLGRWLRTSVLGLGATEAEHLTYWIVAIVWVLGTLPQLPPKLFKLWQNSTVPGSLEEDTLARRLRSMHGA